MQKIVLATNVLSRAFLFQQLGLPFEEIECNIIEKEVDIENENSPYEWVQAISTSKAQAVLDKVEGDAIIIAADTVVTMLGTILHRPKNKAEAMTMLHKLSGKKHTVYTGLDIIFKHADGSYQEENYVDAADVYMDDLTDRIIDAYTNTEEPYDKAGGYAIQGKGAFLINHIFGDYYTVAGLPLRILNKALVKHGIYLIDFSHN